MNCGCMQTWSGPNCHAGRKQPRLRSACMLCVPTPRTRVWCLAPSAAVVELKFICKACVRLTQGLLVLLLLLHDVLVQVLLDMAFCHLEFGKDPEACLRCVTGCARLCRCAHWVYSRRLHLPKPCAACTSLAGWSVAVRCRRQMQSGGAVSVTLTGCACPRRLPHGFNWCGSSILAAFTPAVLLVDLQVH